MNKFIIATLAATFLVPVSAAAQSGPGSAHAQPGVTWQHGGGKHAMPRHGGNRMMPRHHGNQQVVMQHRGGKHMRPGKHMKWGRHHFVRRHHGINRFPHYKHIQRGFNVPHFWWGPRFHVQNWGLYGFRAPVQGQRWIRYYDDALLIDDYGRVHDGRWGMRWDDYEDRWAYDDQGIPYYGEDYGDEDYAYGEGEDGEYLEDYPEYSGHDGPPPPCPQVCPAPMPGYGHGYSYGAPHPQYGYGYGWMHGGMVTVTETTVHAAAPQVVTETVYIEKKVKSKPRRSYKRAKPRPQPGERG